LDPKRFAAVLAVAMMVLCAVSRVLPHPWNFTPLVAMALFGGAMLDKHLWALTATIGSLALGDVALGLFPYDGIAWVYGASGLVVLAGTWLKRRPTAAATAIAAIGGGFLFYAITNFGVWAGGQLYPRTLSGLADCYVAGLPFYRNQLAGDLVYTAVLFGLHRAGTTVYAHYRPAS